MQNNDVYPQEPRQLTPPLTPDNGVWFESASLKGLRDVLAPLLPPSRPPTFGPYLMVNCGEMAITINRIICVLNEFEVSFVVNKDVIPFENVCSKRQKLDNADKKIETHIDNQQVLVVYTLEQCYAVELLQSKIGCRLIIVIPELVELLNKINPIYRDRIEFANLPLSVQEMLANAPVMLHERCTKLESLIQPNSLDSISVTALSDWYVYNRLDPLSLGNHLFEFDDLEPFVSTKLRVVKQDNSMDGGQDILNAFHVNFSDVTVLSGMPGSGKSILMLRMLSILQDRFPNHLVLMRNAKDIIDWNFSNINLYDNMAKVIFRMLNIRLGNRFEKFVLQNMVQNGRVVLLLDGLDEIRMTTARDQLVNLLQWIDGTHFALVMISTWPHRVQFLEEYLGKRSKMTVYEVQPFSQLDRIEYCQQHLGGSSTIDTYGSFIIDKLEIALGIPLFNNLQHYSILPSYCEILVNICHDIQLQQLLRTRHCNY